jgi:hypothetical protein
MGRNNGRASFEGLRERLAQESARLMIEHGIADFGLAKRKAAERFAVRAAGALPTNAEIEHCLAERQRIFEPLTHAARIEELRRVAASIMDTLSAFEPRLAGPVLAGTATINTAIELHVFSATPEAVADVLAQSGANLRAYERRLRYSGGEIATVPGFSFATGAERVVVLVFGEDGVREAPLSPVDGRPMQRVNRAKLARLLAGEVLERT